MSYGKFSPRQNVALNDHSTMGTGGAAEAFSIINSPETLFRAYEWAEYNRKPLRIIGSGSNIIWKDTGFTGLVLKNQMMGFQIKHEDSGSCEVKIGSGELLHSTVERTVQLGLSGIECLSLIPGTWGGAITQNSGAYGQEIADVLVSVEVYDRKDGTLHTLDGAECDFGYRSSRFKHCESQRFAITAVSLKLKISSAVTLRHPALISAMNGRTAATPAEIRAAVIQIRSAKLPDVATVANCGSFFVNPYVDRQTFDLRLRCMDPPCQGERNGSIKVSAGWLIEQSGLKGHQDKALGFGTWPKQALIIVRFEESTTVKLMQYRDAIVAAVERRFGIVLQQEPELLG